eukprot:5266908-Pyramimonas_sp.AAC.1
MDQSPPKAAGAVARQRDELHSGQNSLAEMVVKGRGAMTRAVSRRKETPIIRLMLWQLKSPSERGKGSW